MSLLSVAVMEPIRLVGRNVLELTAPSTGNKIPMIASRGLCFSPWVPSAEEIELLKSGKTIWAIFHGNRIPEFQLIVGDQEMIIPSDVRREMIAGDDPDIREIENKYKAEEASIEFWSEWLARAIAISFFGLVFYIAYRLLS